MMFTKREKQPEQDDEVVNMSLHNHHGFAEATLRAVELRDELAACKATVARLTIRAARGIGHDAREFVQKGGRALPHLGQVLLEEVARKVIAGAKVEDEIQKLKSSETDSIYDRLILQDASDLAFIRTLDDARAAAEILGCSVALHDAAVTRLRSQAITEIARALKPRRERIARQIGKALNALRDALEDETTFANELASQDAGADLAQEMQPKLFSLHILGDAALVAWIRSAQRLGLMANLPQPDATEVQRVRDATAFVSGAGTIAAGTL
jgi:DNA transposition AAA+ family ATPase